MAERKPESLTAPGYAAAVRTVCDSLEDLGHLTDAQRGRALVDAACGPDSTDQQRRAALASLLDWFSPAIKLVQSGKRAP